MNRQHYRLFETLPTVLNNYVSSFSNLEFEDDWLFESPLKVLIFRASLFIV